MANITIYVPDQEPVKYELPDTEQITIGRAPGCDIIVEHSSVSGQHAFIRKIGAGLHMLIDNGSTNGIYLEGEQVSEAPLGNGASFSIGSVPAEYEGGDTTAQPQAEPAADSDAASSEGGYGAPIAPIAETSTRPAGFKDMSPVEKVEKKDSLGQISMIIGGVAILVAIGLIFLTVTMSVA